MAVYVVRPGDTLSGIAKRQGTTLAQLRAVNPQITDPNVINIGMALNLPGEEPVPRVTKLTGEVGWYQVAMEELAHGVAEIVGEANNPRIIEYHSSCTLKATNDETAWCSAFVNWCMQQAGVKGTGNAPARSWLKWKDGTRLTTPRLGCVAVFARGTNPWEGHVGFYVDEDDDMLRILGGNQGNAVSIAPQRKSKLLAYMWPK